MARGFPPERHAANARALEGYLKAYGLGVPVMVEVSGPIAGECSAADRMRGRLFKPTAVPAIPLPDCDRAGNGCACCYSPVVQDEA